MVFPFNQNIKPQIIQIKKRIWKNFINQIEITSIRKYAQKGLSFRSCITAPIFSKDFQITVQKYLI